MFDDMEPEYNFGYSDWLEQQLEMEWEKFLDEVQDEMFLHQGEDPDELGE
jgi:hypothetical protein